MTFTIVSGPATIFGTTLTVTGAGLVTVTATQPGDSNFDPAPPVNRSFTVGKAHQSITFNPPAAQAMTDGSVTLGATASSGLSVSYISNSTGICTVAGNAVTFVSAGTCDLTAQQAGDSNYLAANNVMGSFSIYQATQVITFTPPATQTFTPSAK